MANEYVNFKIVSVCNKGPRTSHQLQLPVIVSQLKHLVNHTMKIQENRDFGAMCMDNKFLKISV